MNCLRMLCSVPLFKRIIASSYRVRVIGNRQSAISGLKLKNPVGLGAGFDKNAKWLRELECLGFGFVEIGTVTPLPQDGNPQPRLFRLKKDKALINRMGFNNDGVQVVKKRLARWKEKQSAIGNQQSLDNSRMIIGGNIGKNKETPNEEAWKDYEICFRELFDVVDYFMVNVSSPNTPGLRELQEKKSLREILSHLQSINALHTIPKPLWLKIAPDLSQEQLDDVISLAEEIKLDGLVATNTTISRAGINNWSKKVVHEKGGLSGLPLKERSTEIVQYICQKTGGNIPVIASGGVFSGADAKEKLDAGASLVQVWTGFIYEGPGIVKRICRSLS